MKDEIVEVFRDYETPQFDEYGNIENYCVESEDYNVVAKDIDNLYKNLSIRTVDEFINGVEFMKANDLWKYFCLTNKSSLEKLRELL